MKSSSYSKFTALREALVKRQAELQEELAEINAALGIEKTPSVTVTSQAAAPPAKSSRGPRKRAQNALSLVEAVLTVTKSKPLSKPDILVAIEEIGYKFSAKDPMNSLNTTLYTSKKIKNFGGTFGPK